MRVLTGIQASGSLHIGNYFGAMKRMIDFQNTTELYTLIANYHPMTTVTDGKKLRENTIEACADYLALGLDPNKAVFWKQSDIPEVHELVWFLSNFTPVALLERCHSYKDKIAKGIPPNHGLFAYPVLMAADILLMQAERIPVGRDQKQHVEVTRDIAIKFNNEYGQIFKVPEPVIDDAVAIIPGIDGQKMSKSYNNLIEIFADEAALKKRVMSIVSDSRGLDDPKDPDKCNIFAILRLFLTDEESAALRERYLKGPLGYGEVKKMLLEKIIAYFSPFRARRTELLKHPDTIHDILSEGAKKARKTALPTIERCRTLVGI